MKTNYPCVLTIAGTDPSGGAGIQADIKTISATGCYAASVITALVAQNTQGVQAIQEISAEFVTQQLNSVFSDLDVKAIKIGMLYNTKIIDVVSDILEKQTIKHIILDPVMVAKDGSRLLAENFVEHLKRRLFPLVYLITPNLYEAEQILERKIATLNQMETAAKDIGDLFNVNVLVKGGHLNSDQSSDVLYCRKETNFVWLHAPRIDTKNTHGTGCTLSSAIASYLAQGFKLKDAIETAKDYLTKAIMAGSSLHIGHGNGPVMHFYDLHFS